MHSIRRRLQPRVFNSLYRHGWWLYDPLTRLIFGDEWDHWRRTALPLIDHGRDRRILDLGCGTGVLASALGHYRFVLAVDMSPAMLRAARKHAASSQNLWLARADAAALPIRDASLDAVVATFPAPFILSGHAVAEIARVLVPGGRLVAVVGGEIHRWPPARRPLRLALKLFYGTARDDIEEREPLTQGALPGDWQTIATPRGEAHVWTATRVSDGMMG